MTPEFLAQYGIEQTTNYVSHALVWLVAIGATCAVVAYIAIRTNDKTWVRRVKREAVK